MDKKYIFWHGRDIKSQLLRMNVVPLDVKLNQVGASAEDYKDKWSGKTFVDF